MTKIEKGTCTINGKTVEIKTSTLEDMLESFSGLLKCESCSKVIGKADPSTGIAVVADDCGCDRSKRTISVKYLSISFPAKPAAKQLAKIKSLRTWEAGKMFHGRGR